MRLFLEHFGAILMALTDFVLFQTVATLLTVAIYFTIPELDASIRQGSADWRWNDIFRIVSPTFTVSGGAITVLTSYFFARKAQQAERELHDARRERQEAEHRRIEAEVKLQTLKAELERATAPCCRSHRPNRRRALR